MASDDIQLARLLDEGLARSALLLVQSRILPSSTGASAFSTARRCSPAAATDPNRQPHPSPQTPLDMSRIEALPSATCRSGCCKPPAAPCTSSATACSGWICASRVRAACCWKSSTTPGYVAILKTGRQGPLRAPRPGLPPAAGELGQSATG